MRCINLTKCSVMNAFLKSRVWENYKHGSVGEIITIQLNNYKEETLWSLPNEDHQLIYKTKSNIISLVKNSPIEAQKKSHIM